MIAQEEDPLHRRSFREFDANGVLLATVDAAGQRLTYGYDNSGNVASITDPLGHTVKYEYNGVRARSARSPMAKATRLVIHIPIAARPPARSMPTA